MPVKGYTSVTVKEEIYEKIKAIAREKDETIAAVIEQLLALYEPPSPPAPLIAQEVRPERTEWKWPGPYEQVILDKRVQHYMSTAWIRTAGYIEKVATPQYGPALMERIQKEEGFKVEKLFVVSEKAWDKREVWNWILVWLTLQFSYPTRVVAYVVKEKRAIDEGINDDYFDMGIYGRGLVGFLDIKPDSSYGKYMWEFDENEVKLALDAFEKLKKLSITRTEIYQTLSKLSA